MTPVGGRPGTVGVRVPGGSVPIGRLHATGESSA